MEKMKTLVSQYKRASLLTLSALVILIGFSAMSAMNVVRQRAAEEAAKAESADEQGMSDGGKDAEEKAELSSSQKKLINGYDDETKKLIRTLSVNVLSANNGRNTLRFHDGYYVETADGKEQNYSYAIPTIEFDNNGPDSEIDHIVFKTDTGTYIVTLTLVISADNMSVDECATASTFMFKLTDMPYERKDTVKETNVTGLNSEIMELLGDTDEMKKQLSNWCSIYFSVTTTVVWIGACNIDHNKDTISATFAIGDGSSSEATGDTGASVSVIYSYSEKKYSFSMQVISPGRKVK